MKPTHVRTTRGVRAAAAVLVLALVGCGSGSGTGTTERGDTLTPQAALAAAVEQTQEVSSYRFALTSTTTVGGNAVEMIADGVARTDGSAAEMTVSMPASGLELRQRVLDGVMYMEMPQEPGVFYSLRLDDVMDTSLAGSADPTQGLEMLRGASDDITEVGRESIRDVEASHYRGTVDVRKALEVLRGPLRDQLEQVLSTGGDRMPFDAWIDDDGRLRRLDQTMTLTMPQLPGQSIDVTSRLEMYDFGVSVDVVAPPAGSVRDGAPLLDAFEGGLAS